MFCQFTVSMSISQLWWSTTALHGVTVGRSWMKDMYMESFLWLHVNLQLSQHKRLNYFFLRKSLRKGKRPLKSWKGKPRHGRKYSQSIASRKAHHQDVQTAPRGQWENTRQPDFLLSEERLEHTLHKRIVQVASGNMGRYFCNY